MIFTEEYETNIIRNFKSIINYKPYLSKDRMAEILYKNIVLNDNLFFEIFKKGYYSRKKCDFTGNNILVLVEKKITKNL